MAVTLTTFAGLVAAATPATVATAIPGSTAAQITALANLLSILCKRPDLALPLYQLSSTAKNEFTLG
jgi:hypothetical protein